MKKTNKSPPGNKAFLVFTVVRKIFVYLFCIVIVAAAILFATSRSPNKSLFGYRYYTVITPSMTPTYKVGDMVFVKLEGADHISVNDVITFNPSRDGDSYLTHRVIEKMENYQGTGVTCFRTKGDANNAEDSFITDEDRVIGVVKFRIPKLGFIVRFVQLRWYFILPLGILLWLSFRLMRIYLTPQQEPESEPEPKPEPDSDRHTIEKGVENHEKSEE